SSRVDGLLLCDGLTLNLAADRVNPTEEGADAPRTPALPLRLNRSGLGGHVRGIRNDPDVGLGLLPLPEQLLRLVVRDGAGDDHALAGLPLGGSRHLVARR